MTRGALQQKTILVVDDESSDQFLIQRAFSQLSPEFDLQVVQSAEDAIRYLEGKEPYQDRGKYPLPVLVLLDLRLPGMSGLDLLKWIRQQSYLEELAIIALTAYGNRDLPRAYDLGIDFYLLKPIQANSLAEILYGLGLYDNGDQNGAQTQ
ncbi:response regulator [Tolypothrix campylonemoides VB511288]|nr:response regulator [Tolypothrix campylonemoides VB511288]